MEQLVELKCHPWSPTEVVSRITVRIRQSAPGTLALVYRLDGSISRVRIPIPSARPSGFIDGLWQHTCFEMFIAEETPTYHELNFSPCGAWAAYAFQRYREGAPLHDPTLAPCIVSQRHGGDRLEVEARVMLAPLSPVYQRAPLRVGLSAVIEETNGALSYWALRHPPGKPDFHHPDAFAVRLEPTGEEC